MAGTKSIETKQVLKDNTKQNQFGKLKKPKET